MLFRSLAWTQHERPRHLQVFQPHGTILDQPCGREQEGKETGGWHHDFALNAMVAEVGTIAEAQRQREDP